MAKRTRTYSAQTSDAMSFLAQQLTAERRLRGWKQSDLAERAGLSVSTLIAIEQGAPTVAIGSVFEVARLLGVPVVGGSMDPLARQLVNDRLALLPLRVTAARTEPDDDF